MPALLDNREENPDISFVLCRSQNYTSFYKLLPAQKSLSATNCVYHLVFVLTRHKFDYLFLLYSSSRLKEHIHIYRDIDMDNYAEHIYGE